MTQIIHMLSLQLLKWYSDNFFGIHSSQLYYPHSRVTEADPKGQGFVVTNFPNGATIEEEQEYMKSYGNNDPKVAALQTLAKNFVVCNRWFASLPGPTVPNRLFVHTASSGGYAGKDLRFVPHL